MATIEIDGKTFEVENGKMIIEVADEAGIPIPRFCYHKKLSVAANCRMCLVEIENNKKTVPACATPINDGMKVFTQSQAALKSQKAVMEFLLINHPLDCPICDQGGECELQDVSMGYGASEGDYSESKRSVDDQSLGSLIATEMTRCIHCTRCVRFGEEVAGLREMGAPGRGEHVEIGTYVEKSLVSEISGNIIDLCPVGALTSKPYRYTARSWELTQTPGIAPHDCLGSNIFLHVRRGELMRVVPQENDSINETWLSDRDRFSYTANYHPSRLSQPMIKQHGEWKSVDWQTALNFVATKLGEILAHHGPDALAALASASATTEELYILQKWMRSLKVNHIDFRLRQKDFSGDADYQAQTCNSLNYADLDSQGAILLFGTNLAREVPLAMAKVRKAALNGAQIATINVCDYPLTVEADVSVVAHPLDFEKQLIALMKALHLPLEGTLARWAETVVCDKKHEEIAQLFLNKKSVIITGAIYEFHPRYAVLKHCIEQIVKQTDIQHVHLSNGANSNGAWAAGFVPHFKAAGQKALQRGMNVYEVLSQSLKAYILHGIDPDFDFDDASLAHNAFQNAEMVVAISAFKTEGLLKNAHVILPMASFAETSGTLVNLDNNWQSFEGAAQAFNAARPAWKIYRVLANLSHCEGFDYVSSQDILNELKELMKSHESPCAELTLPQDMLQADDEIYQITELGLYQCDMMVRHAVPLQQSASADKMQVKLSLKLKNRLALDEQVTLVNGQHSVTLPIRVDDSLFDNIIITEASFTQSKLLGGNFSNIEIKSSVNS